MIKKTAFIALILLVSACGPEPSSLRGKWKHSNSDCVTEFAKGASSDDSKGSFSGCVEALGTGLSGTYALKGTSELTLQYKVREEVGTMFYRDNEITTVLDVKWDDKLLATKGPNGIHLYKRSR